MFCVRLEIRVIKTCILNLHLFLLFLLAPSLGPLQPVAGWCSVREGSAGCPARVVRLVEALT